MLSTPHYLFKRIIPLTKLVKCWGIALKSELSLPSWKQRRHRQHSWQTQNLFWLGKKRGQLCVSARDSSERLNLCDHAWGFISLLACSSPGLIGHNCACGHAAQPASCQFVRKLVPDSDEDIRPGSRFCGIFPEKLLKKQAIVERTWIFWVIICI